MFSYNAVEFEKNLESKNIYDDLTWTTFSPSNSYGFFKTGRIINIQMVGSMKSSVNQGYSMIQGFPKPSRDIYIMLIDNTTKSQIMARLDTNGYLSNFSGDTIPNGHTIFGTFSYVCAE